MGPKVLERGIVRTVALLRETCRCSVGKQEVLAKAIYALLGRVLSFMDRDQNEHILERICELKFKKFPVYLLRLLESLILTETFLIKIQGEVSCNSLSVALVNSLHNPG